MNSIQQKRKKITTLMAVVFVIIFTFIGGYRLLNNSSADQHSLSNDVTTQGLKVKVLSVNNYQVNSTTQQKRSSISVGITNNTGDILQISPGLQMQLVDKSGTSHPMTARYISPNHVIGGPLSSGNNWTDSIDFDIPADQEPTKFIYQVSGSSAPIELGL